MKVERVHDAIDLELLVAVGLVEDREVAGVRGAGGVGWQLRGGFLGREREGEGQEGRGETEAHGASVSGLSSSFQFSVVGFQFFGGGWKILHPGTMRGAYRRV